MLLKTSVYLIYRGSHLKLNWSRGGKSMTAKNAIVTEITMFKVAQWGKSSSYAIKLLNSLKI